MIQLRTRQEQGVCHLLSPDPRASLLSWWEAAPSRPSTSLELAWEQGVGNGPGCLLYAWGFLKTPKVLEVPAKRASLVHFRNFPQLCICLKEDSRDASGVEKLGRHS